MDIRIFDTYEELSKAAAQEVINLVKDNPQAILGLATGSSPLGLYKELINDHQTNNTSYQEVKTFNLDEYFGIDQDHPQSYYKFMLDNLFSHLDIDLAKTHIPRGNVADIDEECKYYNELLSKNNIDIQILGIGANGHIGFNEPGTSFDAVTHHVQLDEKTRQDNARFFNSIDEVPTHAITMGIKNILEAKKIILIASGKNKAEAVKAMAQGQVDPKCPASSLQMHSNVVVFLDKEAASLL